MKKGQSWNTRTSLQHNILFICIHIYSILWSGQYDCQITWSWCVMCKVRRGDYHVIAPLFITINYAIFISYRQCMCIYMIWDIFYVLLLGLFLTNFSPLPLNEGVWKNLPVIGWSEYVKTTDWLADRRCCTISQVLDCYSRNCGLICVHKYVNQLTVTPHNVTSLW